MLWCVRCVTSCNLFYGFVCVAANTGGVIRFIMAGWIVLDAIHQQMTNAVNNTILDISGAGWKLMNNSKH